MNRRRFWLVAAGVTVTVAILVVRNQVKVYQGRQARAALMQQRHPVVQQPLAVVEQRHALFEILQPVALTNCQLERFGERHDGAYLMCSSLLAESSPGTRTGSAAMTSGASKRIVLKIDVEGAEWDSLLSAPDETLEQIDQMAVEFHWQEDEKFHWVQDDKYLRVVRRLKQFFEVGHIHFNNASCIGDLEPFPSWAFEVLFVSKRLAVVDASRKAGGLHPLDAPNNTAYVDCQPKP